MLRGPLYRQDYRPQLSGHETFPLRHGWLKKAFDAVHATEGHDDTVFAGEDAIARFGVGKNMVTSMRHWAMATGILEDVAGGGGIVTTKLGRRLFADDGLDPYMENPATSWLAHWQLCGRPVKTTWFWAFNHYARATFDRETLVEQLGSLARERSWRRASPTTLKNDVTCFIRTYAAAHAGQGSPHEDGLESPLSELGLIKAMGALGGFRFARGSKPSLGLGVFGFAVADFWTRYSTAQTLSFEALAHEPGSPGRVFQLDENDVTDLLSGLEDASGGVYRWSETAGLKQLVRTQSFTPQETMDLLARDYGRPGERV